MIYNWLTGVLAVGATLFCTLSHKCGAKILIFIYLSNFVLMENFKIASSAGNLKILYICNKLHIKLFSGKHYTIWNDYEEIIINNCSYTTDII